MPLTPEERERCFKELEAVQKAIDSAEFRYKRTLMDKTAITNILNASLEEIEKQKRTIEEAGNELNGTLLQLDKQKKLIEEQAREAQIETALERVRSQTLAMQKSGDLADTAFVVFRELILLGLAPARLYINIIKDETGQSECWITGEDGKKLNLIYAGNLTTNPSFLQMFLGWKEGRKSLVLELTGKMLEDYLAHLQRIHVPFSGGLLQKRRLQYIAYFNKGFIGMASPNEQPAETMQLLERFAYVFNLTITRFNDLQRTEEALIELHQTQNQLIQSEKMASLGELTAGIAHEIQNPLNFVNNFSEVSRELIDEMHEELKKGGFAEAEAIAGDLKQNLAKIYHHGKRAEAIVKGMLQHSRSRGQKEPTGINALADEYLRLAYHGLRAKNKSFNATMKTAYDETIGTIHIIPQDIGRVILNLITNAFYAVDEKKQQGAAGYDPTVTVSTKRAANNVEISIGDNGAGIPPHIVDKIFQPFFTTKPAGQGTGLGLSMSYDIVTKGHDGELKVETKEGEGTTFIISLPI